MINLMNEPEILDQHKKQGQILDSNNYVENIFLAIGFASRCWKDDGVFDSEQATRIANELCAYFRLNSKQ